MRRLILLGVSLASAAFGFAGDGYPVPAAWQPRTILGSNFRPLLPATDALWSCPSRVNREKAAKLGVEPVDWPLFRECALFHVGFRTPFDHVSFMEDGWRTDLWRDIPAARNGRTGSVRFEEFFRPPQKESLWENVRPDVPVFVSLAQARPAFLLNARYDQDARDFATWAASQTNFVGFDVLAESENDTTLYVRRFGAITNAALRARLAREMPPPRDPRAWVRFLDKSWERARAFHFGERRLWAMAAGCYTHLLIHAKNGAAGLLYEGSGSQMLANWQVAGAFLRGAARQFGGLPYGWYAAHFYGGYTRAGKGRWGENKWCRYPWSTPDKEPKPDDRDAPYAGTSRSLVARQFAYGYLIGSSFVMPENAHMLFYTRDAQGKYAPSGYAKDLNDLYVFSKTVPRGVSYSTAAILVPISERYGHSFRGWGALDETTHWMDDIFSQLAVFHTLVPVGARENELRKHGFQGCLFNSPYGEFWDVLTPDAGQPSADFHAALSAYRAAFLIGAYRREEVDTGALAAFVRGGGTLVVPADAVQGGLVAGELAGLSFTGETVPSGASCTDEAGRTFALTDAYAWERAIPTTATPLVTDANGAVAVWSNAVGAGRVWTVAAWRLLPARYRGVRESFGDDLSEAARTRYERDYWHGIVDGTRRFDVLRYLFSRTQAETLPVRVRGDVQWGVLKAADGWRVWLMNHKGVIHYSNEPEEFDPAQTAHAKIRLAGLRVRALTDLRTGATMPLTPDAEIVVRPGEWRLLRLDE